VVFAGISSREQAEALRGARLLVPIADVPEAPEGVFYHHQLIGCLCVDAVQGDLGQVSDLLEDGGGLLLVVERQGKRLLIPFVEAYLRSVDVDAGRIALQLPEGLVETCESKS
jgi:16S rRNA processing protein RimM